MALEETKYLVSVRGDCAILAIAGRACYLNCMGVSEFFDALLRDKCKCVIIDFEKCTSLDSTFLGIIAKLALRFKANYSDATLKLVNISDRNLEVVENLGLDKILTIEKSNLDLSGLSDNIGLAPSNQSAMLTAHESLISANSENQKKFEDVITFLKKRVE